jgi:signal transduction histidine kinase
MQVWPVLLVLFAVLVPAVCLLWFMAAAMRNERLAARQRLAEAYQSQLAGVRERLGSSFRELESRLEQLGRSTPPSAAFARCVLEDGLEGALICDAQGSVLYPNASPRLQAGLPAQGPDWERANQLEYFRKDYLAAARAYDQIANASSNVNSAARAFQGEARCLVQAGETASAVRLVEEVLGKDRFRHAVDPQGRLISANAELMVLELTTNHSSPPWDSAARRLRERVMDYEEAAMAAPQRRFLMKELLTLAPATEFSTLGAEELAARFLRSHRGPFADSALHQSGADNLWAFATADRHVTAFLREEKIEQLMRSSLSKVSQEVAIELLPPGLEKPRAFVSIPAGERLPGWRLSLSFTNEALLNVATEQRTRLYLLTGLLVAGGMSVLAFLAVRLFRRQMALAQLKNDLVATVSHELKTPLASMRVLVDTLLGSEEINPETAREYLGIVSRENERLSRLIQNFLSFSRMERSKYTFHFVAQPAGQILATAAQAVQERFSVPGCHFEMAASDPLPAVRADADALLTALLNLLDNAFKYSSENKHILLGGATQNGRVIFSVQDNGIGIAPREARKIFREFYQVDQRLTREGGGCGLGLGIVKYIVAAHQGTVTVESQPGGGSIFRISLPAVSIPAPMPMEVIA